MKPMEVRAGETFLLNGMKVKFKGAEGKNAILEQENGKWTRQFTYGLEALQKIMMRSVKYKLISKRPRTILRAFSLC